MLMTETEYVKFIKELEELQNIFINDGRRIDVDSRILQYRLTARQREMLILLLYEKQYAVANPSFTEQIRRKRLARQQQKRHEQTEL